MKASDTSRRVPALNQGYN